MLSTACTRLILALMYLAAAAVPAAADIYKLVDAQGRVTYSNLPMKGARKLDLGPMPMNFPGPRHRHGHARHEGMMGVPSPANFPRVDPATQHTRDIDRRVILNDELKSQQDLLSAARKQLAATPQDPKAQDNVTFYEKNIHALQTEMARIK